MPCPVRTAAGGGRKNPGRSRLRLMLGENKLGSTAEQSDEWVDGFLFVGNHLSLHLLNTRLVSAEGPVELLSDTAALERWLKAADVPERVGQKKAVHVWPQSTSTKQFLEELLVFREKLRAAVLRFESGKDLQPTFLRELNRKLLEYPRRYIVVSDGDSTMRRTYLEACAPNDVWRALADSAAHLFTDIPAKRVRKCEGCIVHFYDVSKKGSRRWCSMHMCGNREKVATYRQKQRAHEA